MSFLTGSTKSETTLPQWLEQPAREMLQRSIDIGKTGYMPYAGPQVAAMDPAQIASMQNTASAADAFGMNSAMPYIPQATDYGNGISGYSSMPLFNQQMEWMRENRPGQLDFYNSFFVDPTTGENGSNMGETLAQQTRARREEPGNEPDFGPVGHGREGEGMFSGGMFGGYDGLGDMFNGGGPGQSGDKFGGALGGISNGLGRSPNEGGFFGGLFG